jgi:hypothetical protein
MSRPIQASSPRVSRIASLKGSFIWPLLSILPLSVPTVGAAQAPKPVPVTAHDYAFSAPDTLQAGPTVISLHNAGTVRHELVILWLKEGRALSEYIKAGTVEERRALQAGVVGLIVAWPGESAPGRILADLQKGRDYVLICTLQDAPDKPPHARLGMVSMLHIK